MIIKMFVEIDNYAARILDPVLGRHSVRLTLSFLIVLYGSLLSPTLSKQSTTLLRNNVPLRITLLVITLFVATRYPSLAVAIAFIFIMYLDQQGGSEPETFEGPNSVIYPGCMKMTVKDLMESFETSDKLLAAMNYSKVPLNVDVSDYFAPLIATYLLNRGYNLKAPCQWPN